MQVIRSPFLMQKCWIKMEIFIRIIFGQQKHKTIYILKGDGEETFEPHFTFMDFRYIKIEGIAGELKPEDFTAVALYSDMKPTGTFHFFQST